MGGCSPPSFPVKDTNFHSLQSRGIRSVPASIKTENAHGNRQVLPETAGVCFYKQGWLIDSHPGRFWPRAHEVAVGGGFLQSWGWPPLPSREAGEQGGPALLRTESSSPSAPGAETRATGLGTEKCDHRPPPGSYTQRKMQRLHVCSLQDKPHVCSLHSAVNMRRWVVASGAARMVFSQDIALRLFSPSSFLSGLISMV